MFVGRRVTPLLSTRCFSLPILLPLQRSFLHMSPSHNPNRKPVCAVVGIGPGNGTALARRFSREGFAVALLSRKTDLSAQLEKELADSRAVVCDVEKEESVARAFEQVRGELGEVDVVVQNAGRGVFGDIEKVSTADFESCWRVNTLGTFLVAKQVIDHMKSVKSGAFIVIGATSSRRGVARTAAFAPAKSGQRALCESMAKSLWPAGIHVAIIIVDGIVDLPQTRARMPDKPDSFYINPNDLAETAVHLVKQPKSSWSFEVESRPFQENW